MNIILVHGILGFNRIAGIDYFRDVAAHFREKGIKVFVPLLDPTAGIDVRGTQLRNQINTAFDEGFLRPEDKTHIIAHSMGGLDSRWMLSPVNPQAIKLPIRSLTTISTPHLGSPIADIVDSPEKLSAFPHLPFGAHVNPLEPILNELGISLNGLRNLTTDFCKKFSRDFKNNDAVEYFSHAGAGRGGFLKTAAALTLLYLYIKGLTGEDNDGLVAVSSASWGRFDPQTWAADHAEEIGYNLDNLLIPTSLPWLAKYDKIVDAVSAL